MSFEWRRFSIIKKVSFIILVDEHKAATANITGLGQGYRQHELGGNCGIYGIPPAAERGTYDHVATARAFEAFVRSKRGYQMLYADICMTRSEFEDMFEHRHYRAMRDKYRAAGAFPEVYDKVLPEEWLIDLTDQQTIRHTA